MSLIKMVRLGFYSVIVEINVIKWNSISEYEKGITMKENENMYFALMQTIFIVVFSGIRFEISQWLYKKRSLEVASVFTHDSSVISWFF